MTAMERRLRRPEGDTGTTWVGATPPPDWPQQRCEEAATALAQEAGMVPPFSFIRVIDKFGPEAADKAELMPWTGFRGAWID